MTSQIELGVKWDLHRRRRRARCALGPFWTGEPMRCGDVTRRVRTCCKPLAEDGERKTVRVLFILRAYSFCSAPGAFRRLRSTAFLIPLARVRSGQPPELRIGGTHGVPARWRLNTCSI